MQSLMRMTRYGSFNKLNIVNFCVFHVDILCRTLLILSSPTRVLTSDLSVSLPRLVSLPLAQAFADPLIADAQLPLLVRVHAPASPEAPLRSRIAPLPVARDPQRPPSPGFGDLSAVMAAVQAQVPNFPAGEKPKILHGMLRTFHHIHRFNNLAAVFLKDSSQSYRAGIIEQMELNADELAYTNYGHGYRGYAKLHLGIARQIMEDGWGRAEIVAEVKRLQAQVAIAESQFMKPKKQVVDRLEVLRSYVETIPRIVHFIKTDVNEKYFGMIHYLSIMSAVRRLKPDVVYFHTVHDVKSPWFERVRKYVTIRKVQPVMEVNGIPVAYAAHQSDFIRLQILREMGGIYLDWDVIVWRDFDDILNSGVPVTYGLERYVKNFQEALGVAVIIARPRSAFLDLMAEQTPLHFQGAACYTCHSVRLTRYMALRVREDELIVHTLAVDTNYDELLKIVSSSFDRSHCIVCAPSSFPPPPSIPLSPFSCSLQRATKVNVLNSTAFNSPGWDKPGVDDFFLPQNYDPVRDKHLRGPGYASHLFESHENLFDMLEGLTKQTVRTVDTKFNVLVRSLLDDETAS